MNEIADLSLVQGKTMKKAALLFSGLMLLAGPASAQFYKGQTLTITVNYSAGGNVDTDARIIARHLPEHIPGHPNIVIQNLPGAGGLNAIDMLGLNIGSTANGFTAGFFTISPTAPLVDDPALKVKIYDAFIPVGGATGWTIVYGRKDMPPGIKVPSDVAKAQKVYFGGYARSSSHDTRLRLALELMNVKYSDITGFSSAGDITKALLQNEINMTASSLPAYEMQVVPNIITPGIGIPLWYYNTISGDKKPAGNADLEKKGIHGFAQVFKAAFGHDPAGEKFDALLQVNNIATKLQRGFFLPKGSPPEAVDALRTGFNALTADSAFTAEYEKINREKPDLVASGGVQEVLDSMRTVSPDVRALLKASIGGQ